MKKNLRIRPFWLLLLSIGLILPGVCPAADDIRWQSFSSGMKTAETEGRPVLLHFYADWCRFCVKMGNETFRDQAVVGYLSRNFIAIKVNTDREKELARQYLVRGLPTTIIIKSDGSRSGAIPGYLSGPQMLALLNQMHPESGGPPAE
ncbi:MAG: thioredoxin family protein [Thermodesulfobacteriota bacterium]